MQVNGTLAPLDRLIEELQQAAALEDLQNTTETLREYYQVAHVVYHWVNQKGERYGCGTYSQEWVDRYLEMNYLRMDPVIFGCYQSFHPMDWKQLDWSSKAARAFFAEAIEYGVGNQGYSVPMRGPNGQFALFTVSDNQSDEDWAKFIGRNGRDLIVVAHEFNKRALHFELGPEGMVTPSLSPRELGSLTFLAKGLSRAQAADEMQISEHTLRVYIESARHKLGALNTTHAVARALAIGIIVV